MTSAEWREWKRTGLEPLRLRQQRFASNTEPTPPLPAEEKQAEKELQRLCEAELNRRGYLRLTPDNAARKGKGYFGHLTQAQKNPLMPDLFVFSCDITKPPFLVELKVCNKYQPGQREMIEQCIWQEHRTFADFAAALKDWEGA